MGIKILFIVMTSLGSAALGTWLINVVFHEVPGWAVIPLMLMFFVVGGWAGCDLHPIVMESLK